MNTELSRTLEKLKKFLRTEYLERALSGGQIFAIQSSLLFFVLVILESIFRYHSIVRTILLASWEIISGLSFIYYIVIPLILQYRNFSFARYLKAASKIGEGFPQIKDELQNALELASEKDKENSSDAFIEAAFHRVYAKIQSLDFVSLISLKRCFRLLQISISSAVGVLLLVVLIPAFRGASERLLLCGHEFIPPAKYTINVSPGNAKVLKGSDVIINAVVLGGDPRSMNLFIKDKEHDKEEQHVIERDSLLNFRFVLHGVRADAEYWCSLEDVTTEKYKITVVNNPAIQELNLKVRPPAYSGIQPSEQKDNGNVTCLFGSSIDIKIVSSKPLREANIVIADSQYVKLHCIDNIASGTITAKGEVPYKVIIKDFDNNSNLSPVNYVIKTFGDGVPAIELIAPGQNTTLTTEQRLPITVKISDDYGFKSLKLYHRLSASRYEKPQDTYESVNIPFDNMKKEQTVDYIWNLSPLSLSTDEVESYYIEVEDNDAVSGPKKARTVECTIRIPSVTELFKENEKVQERSEDELVKTLQEAQELKKEMENISREMKKDSKEISWEEKEKLQSAAKKFSNLQQKMEKIRQDMKEAANKLDQNNLLSKETMQKYVELQKLMNELTSDEMKKMMEKLQQTLQSLDRKQAQQNLQNMKMDEEAFQKSIDRTINLLKRIQIEQKVDELVKKAQQLEAEQNEIAQKTDKDLGKNSESQNELAKQQKTVEKELKDFQKNLEELKDKMQEFKDLPSDEAEKLEKEFDEQKNDELSKDAQESMKQMQKQSATQKQNKISQNMKKMKKGLEQLQSSLMQKQQMQVFMDMTKLLEGMVSLSKQQEELKDQSKKGEREMSYNENARRQESLKKTLENLLQQMSALAQKTFAISPEMGQALGNAFSRMEAAGTSLQGKSGAQASQNQTEAMKSINEAALMMKQSMESLMQQGGNGGSGMMSLMQQLGKLAGQQMSLNNLTQQLQQGNGGQLSQQQMAQMQRLAQQQELIRKSLEQLNNEARAAGSSKKIPANLDQVMKQMDEVISDMKTEKLNDNLIQKQEKILSKLLDAQRSINESDMEKDRESYTGTNVTRKSPQELKAAGKKQDKLQDQLNNLSREGYAKDYEELIRKYFESLQKSGSN
jgi:hypothetical protein